MEDEKDLREALRDTLAACGYTVECCANGPDGLDALCSGGCDLALLDRMLPGMDGLDVLRQARGAGVRTPVLVLTALDAVGDRVEGLDAGADDYLAKPFAAEELLARVRALLRRTEQGTDHFTAQDISVDTGARRALRGGVELALTAKEFELLTALIRRAGDVVSREALFSEVWGDEKASASKKLDMHISWLRRKLGDDVDSPRYISTVRGLGFRFETR